MTALLFAAFLACSGSEPTESDARGSALEGVSDDEPAEVPDESRLFRVYAGEVTIDVKNSGQILRHRMLVQRGDLRFRHGFLPDMTGLIAAEVHTLSFAEGQDNPRAAEDAVARDVFFEGATASLDVQQVSQLSTELAVGEITPARLHGQIQLGEYAKPVEVLVGIERISESEYRISSVSPLPFTAADFHRELQFAALDRIWKGKLRPEALVSFWFEVRDGPVPGYQPVIRTPITVTRVTGRGSINLEGTPEPPSHTLSSDEIGERWGLEVSPGDSRSTPGARHDGGTPGNEGKLPEMTRDFGVIMGDGGQVQPILGEDDTGF